MGPRLWGITWSRGRRQPLVFGECGVGLGLGAGPFWGTRERSARPGAEIPLESLGAVGPHARRDGIWDLQV